MTTPTTELDARYGDAEASAVPWDRVQDTLKAAKLFWITTIRPENRPHVTPLIAVWAEGSMWFTTGAEERKGLNLAENKNVVLTTGTNALHDGLDVVVEGTAVQRTDEDQLRRIADVYLDKYGEEWRWEIADGQFASGSSRAQVFEVPPETAFAFGKDPYSQTRYRF